MGGLSVSLGGAKCGEGDRAPSGPGRGRGAVQEVEEEERGDEEGEGEAGCSFTSCPSAALLSSAQDISLRRGELAEAGPAEET